MVGAYLGLAVSALTIGTAGFKAVGAVFQLANSVQQLAEAVDAFKPAIESLSSRTSTLEGHAVRTDVVDADQQSALQDLADRVKYLERARR